MKPRKIESLAEGNRAGKLQIWDSHSGLSDSSASIFNNYTILGVTGVCSRL